ncbi:olfactory receptor 476-like [Protobothrops mucrosquamatus]|uniref:olfactory receptor 476-like n=1 Tax=Protobothrops mucrosquamatus TaxID=103944 RepID=UPI0007757CB6|nr:olfactory receptor 476-like [Protobothrops mucrosquamatus]
MDDSINHYISASFPGNRTNIYLDFSTLSETSRKRQILLSDDECLEKGQRQDAKMEPDNVTTETRFILSGLTHHRKEQILLFVVFLIIYLLTVLGNLLIIVLVWINTQLHTPMYFFLTHLAGMEILYVTSSSPQLLAHLMAGNGIISVTRCMLQGASALCMGSTECLLLGVMAYDRYLAICNPLRYASAMDSKRQYLLASSCWVIGCLFSMVNVVCISRHPFCGPNRINHFVCELQFLLDLACGDIKRTKIILNGLATFIVLIPFSVILCSYTCILYSVFQMHSAASWRKAFSTCGSHLIVVTLFYGTIISIYILPQSNTISDQDKQIAVLYVVVTPLLNPIIYTLRNKDVHRAVVKVLKI